MGDTIKARKGLKANIDRLLLGEFGFTTDEERVYIGGNNGNIPLPNAADLSERVKKSLVNITYYINASTGSDTNDGLTSGTAFKTIQHAIDILPQVINHTVDINLSSGTYAEDLSIRGFNGTGSITITGGTSNTDAVNYIVKSITIGQCTISVTCKAIKINTTTQTGIFILNCNYCRIDNCVITDSTATFIGIQCNASSIYIISTIISNKYYAIMADVGSIISSSNNSGSGNTLGLIARNGSTIAKNGTQPSGTTAEAVTSGGEIR